MRQSFPLFQSHLDLAHHYWQRLVKPGDCVIDATCGNGLDTLVLAQLLPGVLYGLDIQQQAIQATQARLQTALSADQLQHVRLLQQSHEQFPAEIHPESVRLIVYNLGYLPGGDKALTTSLDSTLASLQAALSLIQSGGCISLTAYPGHAEGARELQALLDFVKTLDPKLWSCCQHAWLNRQAAPTLLLIQRV